MITAIFTTHPNLWNQMADPGIGGGFSLAFSKGNPFIGGLDYAGLPDLTAGVHGIQTHGAPLLAFVVFQMMFAELDALLAARQNNLARQDVYGLGAAAAGVALAVILLWWAVPARGRVRDELVRPGDVNEPYGTALAVSPTATLVALRLHWLIRRMGRDPAFASGRSPISILDGCRCRIVAGSAATRRAEVEHVS